ncbi:MAG: nitroreductase, partial [Ktedonobacteraceae bacterium]|nr:nitroreductase [Ktedonobacteraceae bacterium]
MNIFSTIIIYGIPCSFILCIVILAMLRYNPRLLLQDYPQDVQQKVPPKTPAEKRVSAYWAAVIFIVMLAFPLVAALSLKASHHGFLDVFLGTFGVLFLFNLVDLLVMDWLIVCTITPKFLVIPGSEGMAGYKNYAV